SHSGQPNQSTQSTQSNQSSQPAQGGGETQASDSGQGQRQPQQDNRGGNQNNAQGTSKRDRFRNRRDRQQRGGDRPRDGGLPQDDGGSGHEQANRMPPPNIPEGFPQYSLGELKRMPAHKLFDIAEQLNIHEGVARARKQEVIFALLKVLTRTNEGVQADGVLEILPDGFGFLRGAEASYLAGPDDTYISPSQIRRFNLRTGDHLSGRIRWPKDGERYF